MTLAWCFSLPHLTLSQNTIAAYFYFIVNKNKCIDIHIHITTHIHITQIVEKSFDLVDEPIVAWKYNNCLSTNLLKRLYYMRCWAWPASQQYLIMFSWVKLAGITKGNDTCFYIVKLQIFHQCSTIKYFLLEAFILVVIWYN